MSAVRAAVHGRPVRRVDEPDVSALVAAMLGAAAAEGETITAIATRMRPASAELTAPDSAVAVAARYYARYRSARPRLGGMSGMEPGVIADYFAAGAWGVCLGGALIDRAAAAKGDVDAIERKARAVMRGIGQKGVVA
jgi:hypothetical protein